MSAPGKQFKPGEPQAAALGEPSAAGAGPLEDDALKGMAGGLGSPVPPGGASFTPMPLPSTPGASAQPGAGPGTDPWAPDAPNAVKP